MTNMLHFELETPLADSAPTRPADDAPVAALLGDVADGAIADAPEAPAPDPAVLEAIENPELPEPPRLSLRDIATESLTIDALLAQAEGELTPALEARLNELGELLARKTDGVVAYLEGLSADADVLSAEEKRLAARRKTLENRVKRFERFVHDQMVRMKRLSIAGDFSKLDIVNNPVKLKIVDEKQIPETFIHTEIIPAQTVRTILDETIKAQLVAREKALAARDKIIAKAIAKQLPVPTFNDAELPQDVPGATLERATRLRIS